MPETVFNLLLFIEGDDIVALGATAHEVEGDDAAKLDFLKSRVNIDCHGAERLALNPPIRHARWQAASRLGRHLEFLEPLLIHLGAGREPLYVITPIVDGYPAFVASTGLGPLDLSAIETVGSWQAGITDYLQAYIHGGVFDIPSLLDDDYVRAIRLLFNAKHYISTAKLLMSMIDTLAFVEFGDTHHNFHRWVEAFLDLAALGVTAAELWEFRNAMLHMTNLESRAAVTGRVMRLAPFVADPNVAPPRTPADHKALNLWVLMQQLNPALTRWISGYNNDPDKMLTFIERYDTILSDTRIATWRLAEAPTEPVVDIS